MRISESIELHIQFVFNDIFFIVAASCYASARIVRRQVGVPQQGFPNFGGGFPQFGAFPQQPGTLNAPSDQQQFNPFVAFHPTNLYNQALNAFMNPNNFNNPNQQQGQNQVQPGPIPNNQTPVQPQHNLEPQPNPQPQSNPIPNKSDPNDLPPLSDTEEENIKDIFNPPQQ